VDEYMGGRETTRQRNGLKFIKIGKEEKRVQRQTVNDVRRMTRDLLALCKWHSSLPRHLLHFGEVDTQTKEEPERIINYAQRNKK
jgi:hypothetical protein